MTTRLRSSVAALVMFAIALLTTCVMTACSSDLTAPQDVDRPLDLAQCANRLVPPTFRIVVGTLEKRDTLPPTTNRYLLPLRGADTAIVTLYDGSRILWIRGGTPGYCLTFRDSLEFHMAGLWTILAS